MSEPLRFPDDNPNADAELAEFNRKPIGQQAFIIANHAFAAERVTRKRVDVALEVLARGFWGRVKWLLTGN